MVALLFKAGDHVPVIPLLDVVGKTVNVPLRHIGATAVKVGVIVKLFTRNCAALLMREWFTEVA